MQFQDLSSPASWRRRSRRRCSSSGARSTRSCARSGTTTRDGRTVWGLLHVSLVRDAAGAPAQLLGQVEDITDRKERELVLAHDVEHDSLTGLWNRAGLHHIIADLWADRRPETPVALLFADLDRFKQVNDDLGHSAGDEVARERRPPAQRRGPGRRHRRPLGRRRVRRGLSERHEPRRGRTRRGADPSRRSRSRSASVPASASIGVSVGIGVDAGHDSPEVLLDDADAAAYAAKLAGGDAVRFAGDVPLIPSTRSRARGGTD